MNAPELSSDDAQYGLVLIDGTWRLAKKMIENIPALKQTIARSIPQRFRTAYPRRQQDCPDPESGLASIEALWIAYSILGRDTTGLLDMYYWKDEFIKKNFN